MRGAHLIAHGARVWLAAGATNMRKGFDGLARLVDEKLARDPFGGQLFVFRGRRSLFFNPTNFRGDYRTARGLCLFAKRLERGHFVWPAAADGACVLSPAQLSMLLEGIDWRMPARTTTSETPAPRVAG